MPTTDSNVDLDEISQKVFKRSSEQAANLESSVRSLQAILTNLSDCQMSASQVAEIAHDALSRVEESKFKIGSLKNLFKVIQRFQSNFKSLSHMVHQIQENTDFLNAIALKSEKLSYNAEIEASRAGVESGRFSVIAVEIHNLTEMNRNAASKISGIVNKCIDTVEEYSNQIKHTLDEGHSVVTDVETAFEVIKEETNTMVSQSKSINQKSELQLEATKEVNESVKTEIESYSKLVSELIEDLTGSKIIEISPDEVKDILDQYVIIDVRGKEEYNDSLGHIEASSNHPINGDLRADLHPYDRNKKMLFVCRSGGRSARAARQAQGLGFKHVFNLTGGMLAWNKENLPRTG